MKLAEECNRRSHLDRCRCRGRRTEPSLQGINRAPSSPPSPVSGGVPPVSSKRGGVQREEHRGVTLFGFASCDCRVQPLQEYRSYRNSLTVDFCQAVTWSAEILPWVGAPYPAKNTKPMHHIRMIKRKHVPFSRMSDHSDPLLPPPYPDSQPCLRSFGVPRTCPQV